MPRKLVVEYLIPDDCNLRADQLALVLRDALHEFARRGTVQTPPRIDAEAYVNNRYGGASYSDQFRASKLTDTRERVEFATEAIQCSAKVIDCLVNDLGETLECTYGQPGANVDTYCGKPATVHTVHGDRCEEHK